MYQDTKSSLDHIFAVEMSLHARLTGLQKALIKVLNLTDEQASDFIREATAGYKDNMTKFVAIQRRTNPSVADALEKILNIKGYNPYLWEPQ